MREQQISFLKFKNEEEFRKILNTLEDVQEMSSEIKTKKLTFSVIGKIPSGNLIEILDQEGKPVFAKGTETKPDGITKYQKGDVIQEIEFIEGFHVNSLGILPKSFHEFRCDVKSPIRIFG